MEKTDNKRKRSSEYSSEKPQEAGPSGGGERETEEARIKRRENGDAPVVEIGAIGREMASSSGAQINATMEQEARVAGFFINSHVIDLQRIKLHEEELDRRHSSTRVQLKKGMEEEMERIRRWFEEKVKEEEGRHQQELVQLVDTYQKVLHYKSLTKELLDKFILQCGFSASASGSGSGSSQVPEHRPQLGPQPVPAPVPVPVPAPPHIGSTTLHRTSTPPSASTASFRFRPTGTTLPPRTSPAHGAVHRAPYSSQPHLSDLLAVSTPAPNPHLPSSRPHPSVTVSTSTARAPGAVLRAPPPHLARLWPYSSAIPSTSTPSGAYGPGLRSTIPSVSNGNTNYGTGTGTSTRRNGITGTGTSGGCNDVVCLSDDD